MQVKNSLLISASIILFIDIVLPVNTSKYVDDASPEEEVEDTGANKQKEDSALPSHRVTSARAYIADRNSKLGGFRYYGTGSKSGNSFAPTSVHKSTSLDTLNYFVTSKGNNKAKDMEAAGSGMNGNSDGNYLTVYEPPRDTAAGSNNYMVMDNGNNNGGMMGTGNMALEETFGNMMAETGHGGGYGHGGGGGKGCNSALGLLGVLGLAAYLQNVLRNMNGQATEQRSMGGRRKREVGFEDPFDTERVRTGMAHLDWYLLELNETSKDAKLDKRTYNIVMQDVFPLLSAVAHARDGLIPIHCTHSSVCLANQVLVRDLGNMGHSIGIRISSTIAKLLARLTKDERAEQIRMIPKAGKMGRNGRNCLKVFPTCNRLRKLPIYNIPPVTENHDESEGIQSAS